MNLEPAIYKGTLRHRRFSPKTNNFEYPLFMAFLDVDTIPETMERVRFGGYNRFNWASYHEQDFFGDAKLGIRERVTRDAAEQGIELPQGRMYMLTHLRYLGYCFNPATFYFCYSEDGGAPRILTEVNNTFSEHRNYWLGPQNALPAENSFKFRCAKDFHVSPFMGMDLEYDFTFTQPAEKLVAHVNVLRGGEAFFDATLALDRYAWTSANLTRTLAQYPFVTGKVIAAIHWQALRLLVKGVPVFTHPARKERPAG
jgi:uncharacterized protein